MSCEFKKIVVLYAFGGLHVLHFQGTLSHPRPFHWMLHISTVALIF